MIPFMIALGEIGVKEISGPKHNPTVLRYHDYTTLDAATDEVPWCSSFINYCFAQAGMYRTNSARAKSWADHGYKLEKPKVGCVIVLHRGSNPAQGHVGFYVGENKDYYFVLGGNQSNEVNVSMYPKSKLYKFRGYPGLDLFNLYSTFNSEEKL